MTGLEVMLAYGTKIIFGCLYGYIFLHFYQGDDTWALHARSITEKQMLLDDPYHFFLEFTPGTAIKNGNSIIDIAGLYLNDLEYCLQAKTLGIINLISQDNYFVNVVFWNFFIFWGHYWLFKLLVKEFPAKRKFYFILIFLFPPALFWLSGIRSDGLIFFSCSLLLLYFHHWLSTHRFSSLVLWIAGFFGILIFRAALGALLVPALLSWWLANRFTQKPLRWFIWVYFLAAFIFFVSTIFPSYSLPDIVVKRQQEFMQLKGTAFSLDTLQPTVKSFAAVFHQAAINTFIRPFAWEAKGVLQWMAALDILIFWGMLVFVFLRPEPDWKRIIAHPLILLFFFWAASLYLFIGYSIPFPGAIVRYKIIGEIYLLAALGTMIKLPRTHFKLK